MRKLTFEQFVDKSRAVHGDKYQYTTYEKNSVKTAIICPVHGEFLQRPLDHMRSDGCPSCKFEHISSLKRSTSDAFRQKAREIYGRYYDYTDVVYVNAVTRVTIGCPIHGSFSVTPDKHLGGVGCVKCSKGTSHGERKIQQWLDQRGIVYERETRFPGLCGSTPNSRLRYDFYLPSYNLLIEYDGEHHFRPVRTKGRLSAEQAIDRRLCTVENDVKKTEYARLNSIELLRIRYDQDLSLTLDRHVAEIAAQALTLAYSGAGVKS